MTQNWQYKDAAQKPKAQLKTAVIFNICKIHYFYNDQVFKWFQVIASFSQLFMSSNR